MKTTRTDWRKYRKSTHLASADLDIMTSEGKSLIFNIKEVKFQEKVNVSGSKMDGFFCYFKEPIKALKLNTENLLTLASFVKNKGIDAKDIYVVENYNNLKIELYVDRNVKFMGDIVDGVRIKKIQPSNNNKPDFTEAHFIKAKEAKATIQLIKKSYNISSDIEIKYNEYSRTKE